MSKPTAGFVFGAPSTGGSNSSQNPSNTATSNPFGGSGTQQNTFFGESTSQPTSSLSLFGTSTPVAGAPKPSAFGSNPGSGTVTPSFFGVGTSTGNQAGGIFGGGGSTTGTTNALGSGYAFGKKPEENKDTSTPANNSFPAPDKSGTPTQAQQGMHFGGAGFNSGTSVFGSSTPLSSAPTGSTTPATTKPGAMFNFANSTTPAGAPPRDNSAGGKTGLFGSAQPSSGLFGSSKPAVSMPNAASSQPTGLFGGTTTGGSSSTLFAPANEAPASGAGVFSSLNAPNPATSGSSTIASSTMTSAAAKPSFSFPPAGSMTASPSTLGPSSSATGANPFGATTASTPSTSTATSGKTTSLFSSLTPNIKSSSTPTPAPAPTLFSGLGKPNITATTVATSAPGANISAPTSLLFVPKTSETTSATTTTTTTTSAAPAAFTPAPTGAVALGASTSGPLGASTAGPAPQLSRLKNKTMDEIITRWATDLSTYQKEFQSQAAKVASWDRLLVENGDKIQKLYTSTFEAERASAEVERQLASVESQQDELTAWLDHYEREVNDMFVKQVGHGEALQGPDQERERTYKLAEKLTDRLDEMGKDLTSMIQEINTASATLTKTSKPDDPLSQIVRVLNGHLSQLQWIDQNATALQAKVAAAQKAGQSIASSSYGTAENDPADDFYRSYMGRR